MLLGAAVLLAAERSALAGAIKFLFQPAEEGPGGALPMIEAGALRDPDVDAAAMLHVTPLLPAGVIGWRCGPMNASCDDFEIRIVGRGGHGAPPPRAADAIPAAAEFVPALQRIRSRDVDPLESVVRSIGTLNAGYRRNIVADEAILGGTIRCLNEEVRAAMPARIERIAGAVSSAHGARCTCSFELGYPVVINQPRLTEQLRDLFVRTA